MKWKKKDKRGRRGGEREVKGEGKAEDRMRVAQRKHECNIVLVLGHICCQGNASHNSDNWYKIHFIA